jgi:hypothetical protein
VKAIFSEQLNNWHVEGLSDSSDAFDRRLPAAASDVGEISPVKSAAYSEFFLRYMKGDSPVSDRGA